MTWLLFSVHLGGGILGAICVALFKQDTGLVFTENSELAGMVRFSYWFSWLVVLRLNVPVNNFSVMSGRSHRFLGN